MLLLLLLPLLPLLLLLSPSDAKATGFLKGLGLSIFILVIGFGGGEDGDDPEEEDILGERQIRMRGKIDTEMWTTLNNITQVIERGKGTSKGAWKD